MTRVPEDVVERRPVLTKANRRTLDALTAFIAAHGYPPSVTQLAEAVGVSRTAVQVQLQHLQAKGAIRRAPREARGIEVLG